MALVELARRLPGVRLTLRPRFTAGRARSIEAHRSTFLYSSTGEIRRTVQPAFHEPSVPGEHRHIGDCVAVAGDVFGLREPTVKARRADASPPSRIDRSHIRFSSAHRHRSGQAPAEKGRASHLPKQPRQALGAGRCAWQQSPELLGEIQEYRTGLKDPDRPRRAIHQCRDLGIRIDGDEAAAELIAIDDIDEPRIVLGTERPSANSSSSRIVTFTPFGVPRE